MRVQTATRRLSALAADAARQLNVLRHDRDALGVDCAQIGVLEETDEVAASNKVCFECSTRNQ